MKHHKNRQCPQCGSDKIIPIVYGYIDDPDVIQKIENGEFDSGGCCVDDESPKWKCRECEERFGTMDWV
jgi:hypothetical protein